MWPDLARAIFNELYPPHPDRAEADKHDRENRFRGANPLRIASEYEAAFTKAKLDELIKAQVPDSQYQPGRLHQLLLKLPWADVFTTNYDTLLERTEVPGRVYQTVTRASELTSAFAPRIVKLHGSLPSETPFIVSEEDYRTYPRLYAPFVNSVQQSLLENSFVLIGFSGDDPNFLEWTGWIRDELGEAHAPIYLVGPLSIEAAQRSLLARRGVTPIDLSPALAGTQPPIGIHAASMEWFLSCLSAARPPRPELWPELHDSPSVAPVGCPPLVDPRPVAPKNVGRSPRSLAPFNEGAVAEVLARWRFERRNYPGWLVAPAEKRTEVWEETKFWIQPLTTFASDRPAVDRLFIFFEINWRLQISMVPLFMLDLEPFQKALDELTDAIIENRLLVPPSNYMPSEAVSGPSPADAWFEAAFGFMRSARESYDAQRWNELKGKLDKAVRQYPQHADRFQYEAALWAMWNVDRRSAKAVLSHWQPSPYSPLDGMRKAGLLAELDELGEARIILRTALAEVRRALRNQGQNVELLSLEGWCSYLLYAVESSIGFASADLARRSDLLEEFRERWEELKAWDCSPWTYKEYFDEALSPLPPKPQKFSEEVAGFDPGRVTVSTYWDVDHIGRYLPGFSYVRFHEQVGIPVRMRLMQIGGDCLNRACRWIAPFFVFGAPALLIRAGELDELAKGKLLTRVQVYTMDPALAKRLHLWCVGILERELSSITGLVAFGSSQESTIKVLPEVLSRLALRLNPSELRQAFALALRLYHHFAVRTDVRLNNCCALWFERLFEAADPDLLLEWLPSLIKGGLGNVDASTMASATEGWPDPMRYFPKRDFSGMKDAHPDLIAKISEATDWLVKRASTESEETKHSALARLVTLYYIGLMTGVQKLELQKLLWTGTDGKSLPDLPRVFLVTILHLPAPTEVDVCSLAKNRILTLPVTGVVGADPFGHMTVTVTGPEQPLILEASFATKPLIQLNDEARGLIDWTSEEAKQLYLKAREWWANDKRAFDAEKDPSFGLMGPNPVLKTLNRLGQFLSRVVLPQMVSATDAEWLELLSWLEEIRAAGAFLTEALPYILLNRPSMADAAGATIASDLVGSVDGAVAAAAKAVRHWFHLSMAGRVPSLPSTLKAALIERVVFRRRPGIDACLWHLANLIAERPDAIAPAEAELLTASLLPWNDATLLPASERDSCGFPDDERPTLRVGVGRLAGALSIWHEKFPSGTPEPLGVALWRDACKSDCLPEVRRAFGFWETLA
jgi:tetratricopeptide (TPR) repeat protein